MKVIYDNIQTNKEYQMQSLNAIDQEKYARIKSESAKKLHLLTRYLLSSLLKEDNLDYLTLPITLSANGKPQTTNIYFSLSHSHDMGAVATSHNPIGIDIELIRDFNLDTLKHIATDKEKDAILKTNNPNINFFRLFTLKEAYIKMKGLNLSNLKSIEFIITNNNIQCSDSSVTFKLIEDIPNYMLAIVEAK